MSLLRWLLPWLAILVLAFANGALRELLLVPRLGDPWALIFSGVLLCACVLGVTWLALPRVRVTGVRQALALGALWLVLTLAFEFGFGRLVQHKPWGELLAAYGFERGNLWPVVLAVILLGPAVLVRLRANRRASTSSTSD